MAEEILFFTELLGLKVFDLKGRRLGVVRDVAIVPLVDPVRVDRYLIGTGSTWLNVRYDQVRSISLGGIFLRDEILTPYHSDEYMLRVRAGTFSTSRSLMRRDARSSGSPISPSKSARRARVTFSGYWISTSA